jgi:hypothetical protein
VARLGWAWPGSAEHFKVMDLSNRMIEIKARAPYDLMILSEVAFRTGLTRNMVTSWARLGHVAGERRRGIWLVSLGDVRRVRNERRAAMRARLRAAKLRRGRYLCVECGRKHRKGGRKRCQACYRKLLRHGGYALVNGQHVPNATTYMVIRALRAENAELHAQVAALRAK